MTGVLMAGYAKKVVKPDLTWTTKSAWADHVQDRWKHHTSKYIMREWDLEPHEARAILDKRISGALQEKIFDHPNGGVLLALDLLLRRFRLNLDGLADEIEQREELNAHERAREQARIERESRARRSLESRCRLDAGEDK